MNDRQQQNRPPLDFQEVKVVSDFTTRLAVRVVRATGDTGRRMYRYAIGTLGRVGTDAESKFFREVSVFIDIRDQRVSVRGLDAGVIGKLVAEAEEFIRADMQEHIDQQPPRPRHDGPPGLKTLSRRDAQRRGDRGERGDRRRGGED